MSRPSASGNHHEIRSENALQLFSRLRHVSSQPLDHPILLGDGLTLIDWSLSDREALQYFLNELILKVLSSPVAAIPRPAAKRTGDETQEMAEDEKSVKENENRIKRRSLAVIGIRRDQPLVQVFDGLAAFDLLHLASTLEDTSLLDRMEIIRELDPFLLFVAFRKHFEEQLAFNLELKLIVVYSNETLVDKMLTLIRRKKGLPLHLLFISSRLPRGSLNSSLLPFHQIKVTSSAPGHYQVYKFATEENDAHLIDKYIEDSSQESNSLNEN